MHIVIWGIVIAGLGLWSLAAWGLFMLMGLDPSWVGQLNLLLVGLPFGDWLDQWLPGWQAMVGALIDLTQDLLGGLGSAGMWLVAGLWAMGAIGLLCSGLVLSVAVALVRRARRSAATTRPGPTALA